jgi:hypothetical protein
MPKPGEKPRYAQPLQDKSRAGKAEPWYRMGGRESTLASVDPVRPCSTISSRGAAAAVRGVCDSD